MAYRSMDDSATTDASPELLTIACRFVPYDQWLITHVDPSWKVSQVKAWLLAKCYDSFTTPRNASSSLSTADPTTAPPINPPERPQPRKNRRPASPIVFAPEPPNANVYGRDAYDSDEDQDIDGDNGHYYDEHGIYGAGDPEFRAGDKAEAEVSSVGKSSAGVSNFSYVSQISGLTYASTASKASKHSHRSKSSRLSLVSEGEKSPHDEEAQSPGTPTEPPFSGNFNDLMPIDTNLVFTQGKSNTDTIRPKRKKGPKGPRRPISPMTFVPMGKSPTSAHVNKGGFAPYETYATYSPEEPTPGMSIARGIGEMEQTEMQSIDSGSTVPATGVKALRDGPGKAYKRFLGEEFSSEDEGTVFDMGYEDEDEEDDEYDEEDEEGQDRDKDNEEQEDEHVDDNAPPPGTGRIGPPPPMLAPNRPDMSTISSSTTTIVPGSSGSHTHTGTSQSQSNITTLGTLFSSKAAKDKDKSKRDKKEKEKFKSKSKEQKKKEKEKPHRSKLEKADRGDRTKDWVEYERSKEREREMFTSSISAMSGLTNKTRTRTRDRDLRDGKDTMSSRDREKGDYARERARRERQIQRRAGGQTPSFDTYHPMQVTVIRFSTGQILEDQFALGWYELNPYELLEIHRKGVVLGLPRTITIDYIAPYWEGYVRALRVVLRAPPNSLGLSGSNAGVGGGSVSGGSTARGKDLREIQENRLRERIKAGGGLERHSSVREKGEDSYDREKDRDREWERGGDREGKDSWDIRRATSRHTHAQGHKRKDSLGPYYTAGLGTGSSYPADDKDRYFAHASVGSQSSQHSQSHAQSQGHSRRAGSEHDSKKRRSPVYCDWRDRWVFIKDGVLNVWKERDDPTTAQYLPLADLTEIRGSEQLGRGMLGLTASTSSHRIVCAKFKGKLKEGRGDSFKEKERKKERERERESQTLVRLPESTSVPTSTSMHGHGYPQSRALGTVAPQISSHIQTTIVSNTITADGRIGTSSQPGFSTSPKPMTKSPTTSMSTSFKSGQTYASMPPSAPGSPPTSNPGSLSSSPTFRPYLPPPPLSMRIQSPELLSAAVTSEKDREMERLIAVGRSSGFKSTSTSRTATENTEGSVYPDIKGKGKARLLSNDGHETDDEAEGDGVVSDGNMSASGFLGRAESPPFVSGVTKHGGIRPLPSLPSTPAFPEYVPRSVESTSPNTASPNDKDKGGQDQDDTVKLGVHPRIEADLEDDELSGFSSDGTLSPVYSDSDSDVGSMRRGYGYDFHNERKKKIKEERDGEGRRVSVGVGAVDEGRDSERDRGRWNPTVHDGEGDSVVGEADSSYVHVDHLSETREQGRATPRAHSSRPKNRVKSREKESTGEWIVLDLQDDHAFGSFLRVLHRYAPHALSSTFWSQLSSFVPPPQAPAPAAPTPATPTPTPVAGSTSFPDGHKVEGSDFLVERLRRIPENPENISESGSIPSSRHQFDGMSSVPTTATFSSEQSTSLLAQHRSLPSLSIPSSKPDFHHPSPLQALRSKRPHSNSGLGDTYGTLGALPYPEWRTEVVTRAQRAGMGTLTPAMEWSLFQDGNLGISSSVLGFNPQGFFSANKANRVGPTLFMGEDNNSEANLRGKRKRGRKMTIEQENIAMGIGTDNPIDGKSIHTIEKDVQSLDVESESTDSGDESSDTEWMGWMADLHRQAQVMKEAETKKQLVEEDLDEYPSDCNPQNDHRRYQEKQKLLRPSATVIVTAPNQHSHQRSATPPNPGQTSRSQFPAMPITPQVLTSPSSNESLNLSGRSRGRKLSFGLSTAEQPSPPSTIGRLERSNSRSRIQTQHQHQPSNSRTPNLLHFASTGLIGGLISHGDSPYPQHNEANLSSYQTHFLTLYDSQPPELPSIDTSFPNFNRDLNSYENFAINLDKEPMTTAGRDFCLCSSIPDDELELSYPQNNQKVLHHTSLLSPVQVTSVPRPTMYSVEGSGEDVPHSCSRLVRLPKAGDQNTGTFDLDTPELSHPSDSNDGASSEIESALLDTLQLSVARSNATSIPDKDLLTLNGEVSEVVPANNLNINSSSEAISWSQQSTDTTEMFAIRHLLNVRVVEGSNVLQQAAPVDSSELTFQTLREASLELLRLLADDETPGIGLDVFPPDKPTVYRRKRRSRGSIWHRLLPRDWGGLTHCWSRYDTPGSNSPPETIKFGRQAAYQCNRKSRRRVDPIWFLHHHDWGPSVRWATYRRSRRLPKRRSDDFYDWIDSLATSWSSSPQGAFQNSSDFGISGSSFVACENYNMTTNHYNHPLGPGNGGVSPEGLLRQIQIERRMLELERRMMQVERSILNIEVCGMFFLSFVTEVPLIGFNPQRSMFNIEQKLDRLQSRLPPEPDPPPDPHAYYSHDPHRSSSYSSPHTHHPAPDFYANHAHNHYGSSFYSTPSTHNPPSNLYTDYDRSHSMNSSDRIPRQHYPPHGSDTYHDRHPTNSSHGARRRYHPYSPPNRRYASPVHSDFRSGHSVFDTSTQNSNNNECTDYRAT
ncbi:hypothetical protein K435DRAFT_969599 [Dendrothele bispora CBS 962.96]|uniref:PH domain-containing protein n=1 Tax=Dendrothele bispora (strain CBS 962.96) TaxID=1314807 RepID=A0A4V4HDR0_DENBC|nr:hypothetical protein K435DRAFT_969599 [Dendrothele bispora CBS 962.96]